MAILPRIVDGTRGKANGWDGLSESDKLSDAAWVANCESAKRGGTGF